MINEIVAAILFLVGALFAFIGGLGLIRLPDVFCRGHALSKAMTLGIILMLAAYWVRQGEGVLLLLAIGFLFATLPVSAHLLTQAARRDPYVSVAPNTTVEDDSKPHT